MAVRMCVTSVILAGLPRGKPLVSRDGGQSFARFGHIDVTSTAVCHTAARAILLPETDPVYRGGSGERSRAAALPVECGGGFWGGGSGTREALPVGCRG